MTPQQEQPPRTDALREALERLKMAADAVDSGEPLQAEPYLTAYREAWTELEEAIEQAQVALSATTPSPSSGLDVTRLARALAKFDQQWPIGQKHKAHIHEVDEQTFAEQIAAEYARLKEQQP